MKTFVLPPLGLTKVLMHHLLLIAMLLSINALQAADFYWKPNGNYQASLSSNWYNSGGSGVPQAGDNVIINSTHAGTSTTIYFDESFSCNDFIVDNSIVDLTIDGNPLRVLRIYGEVDWNSSNTTVVDFSGLIWFDGQSSFVSKEIKTYGANIPGRIEFNAPNGEWILATNFSCSSEVTLLEGHLITSSTTSPQNQVSFARFSSNLDSYTRTFDISNTILTITSAVSAGQSWRSTNSSNLTFISTNSEVRFTQNAGSYNYAASLEASNLAFDDVVFMNTQGNAEIEGDQLSFNTLTLQGNLDLRNSIDVVDWTIDPGVAVEFEPGITVTLTGDMLATSTCNESPIILRSLVSSQIATIDASSANSVTADEVIVESIELLGSWSLGTIYNMTNSSGWPTGFGSTSTIVWNGTIDDAWSNPSNWSSGCLPTPLNDVVINPSATNNLEVDIVSVVCRNLDFSAAPTGFSFTSSEQANDIHVYGSLTLKNDMNYNAVCDLFFMSHGVTPSSSIEYLASNGQTIPGRVHFYGQGGHWQLSDVLTVGDIIYQYAGTLTTNNHNVTAKAFNSKVRNSRTINLGSSLIELEDYWSVHLATSPASYDNTLLLNEGASLIRITEGEFQNSQDWGETYNDVELFDPNGTQNVWGDNTFHHLKFYGGGLLRDENHFPANSTLEFTAGKEYTNFSVQNIDGGSFVANGNCTGLIRLSGGSFTQASGASVSASYMIIENCTASTSPNPTLFTITTFGLIDDPALSPGWLVGPQTSYDLYFQANGQGSGNSNWNEPLNWFEDEDLTIPHNCPPMPIDNVFFVGDNGNNNGGSFDATYDHVMVDEANVYCKSITWDKLLGFVGVPEILSSNANNKLNIYGSMYLNPSTAEMEWNYEGETWFRGSDVGLEVHSHQHEFEGDVFFKGDGGEWTLLSDFKSEQGSHGTYVQKGSFISDGFDVVSGFFHATGGVSTTVDITGSEVDLEVFTGKTSDVLRVTAGVTFHANSNCTINIGKISTQNNQAAAIELDADDVEFDAVNFLSTADFECRINGNDNTFNSAIFSGNGRIMGSNDFIYLEFSPGYEYVLNSGTTQHIKTTSGEFAAYGTSGNSIYIYSSQTGQRAYIESDAKICLQEVELSDNEASYTSLVPNYQFDFPRADFSENVSNNYGWSFTNCNDTIIELCDGDSVTFTDYINNGEFDWDFGDGGTSTEQFPTHVFYVQSGQSTTTYHVTVEIEVFDGQESQGTWDFRYYTVIVDGNCCPIEDDPNFVHKGGIISSDEYWDNKIYVTEDVFVQGNTLLDITTCDVLFANEVGIYFEDGSEVRATNSTFRPCNANNFWSGIHLTEESYGELTENTLIQPEAGVSIATPGPINVVSNQFSNFNYGVFVQTAAGGLQDHVISGNEFTLDQRVDDLGYSSNLYYGINLEFADLAPSVASNEFHYNIKSDDQSKTYGIYNLGGSLTASNNEFTNVFFPYFQMVNSNVCVFEGNKIIYDNSFTQQVGIPFSQIAGVTIESGAILTYISGNTFQNLSSFAEEGFAIYSHSTFGIEVHENQIDGFEHGIYSSFTETSAIGNHIKNCLIGMHIEETVVADVKNNSIEQTLDGGVGISLFNCFDNSSISSNVVDNDLALSTHGIYYHVGNVGPSSTVDISGNCILDCQTAMSFVSAVPCSDIPRIRNNYLYNYASGIETSNFQGTIGVPTSDPGANSFVSNDATAMDFFNFTDPMCFVDLHENWPQNLNTHMGVWPQPNPWASTSSCGRQTSNYKLSLSRTAEEMLEAKYKLEIANGVVDFTESSISQILDADSEPGLAVAQDMVQILLANASSHYASALIERVKGGFSGAEVAWLSHYVQRSDFEFQKASASLDQASATSVDAFTITSTAFLIDALSERKKLQELDASTKLKFKELYETYPNERSRSWLRAMEGGYLYRYKTSEFVDALPDPASMGETDMGFTIYPNPSSGVVDMSFSHLQSSEATISVFDAFGRQLLHEQLNTPTFFHRVDLSAFGSGFYIIHVEDPLAQQRWIERVEIIR